ncbi:MAG: ABC transporter permease, partial [Nocardioides sp.]|nr:ABC transporter permease [Nocardioides sp.]
TLWGDALRTLVRRPTVILAALVALFFLFMMVFPHAFTSIDPQHCDIRSAKLHPQGFGHAHVFGTDVHGCDVYAQLVSGARSSLVLALVVVAVSVVIGTALGLLAGYYLGWVDVVISRVVEVFIVIPLLLAALLVLSLFHHVGSGNGTFAAIIQPAIVMTAFAWMKYTRYVRASVLETKSLDYVTAARVMGASDLRIMVRHILPNAVGTVTALVPTAIVDVISLEAVLAFLGIGVRPPAISWGIMISNGAEWFLGGYQYLLLVPLVCLLATVLAFVVIGDNLRDALDPKLR